MPTTTQEEDRGGPGEEFSNEKALNQVNSKKNAVRLTAEQEEDLKDIAVLRVEQTGNLEANVLEVLFFLFMFIFVAYGIAVIIISATVSAPDGTSTDTSDNKKYYLGNTVILAVLLGILVYMALFFSYRMTNVWRNKKSYKSRQKFLVWDARIIGVLALVDLVMVTIFYAFYYDSTCIPNTTVLSILGLFRSICSVGVLAWMTIAARLMQVYRKHRSRIGYSSGKDRKEEDPVADEAPDDPDRILLIDQPIKVILREQAVFLTVYGVVIAVLVVAAILQTAAGNTFVPPIDPSTCPPELFENEKLSCSTKTPDIIGYVISSVAIIFFMVCYSIGVRKSWRAQKDLPNSHFRLSKIYLRIQMRYGRLLFVAIFFGDVITNLATLGTCRGVVQAVIGSPSSHLALAVYACTVLLLFAPARANDTYSHMIFKSIAWTEDDIPEKKRERLEKIEMMNQHQSLLNLTASPAKFLAKQIGVPDTFALFEKPMESIFCVEYMCKLFFWSRAAYRGIEKGLPDYVTEENQDKYPYTIDTCLQTFGMKEFEYFYEESTDTYAIMGSGNDTVVVSFRGTASNANIMTDLKAWSVRYEPHPYLTSSDTLGGSDNALSSKVFKAPVRVHKGFYQAWTAEGFNTRVIDSVVERVNGMIANGSEPSKIKIYVTGHSLGGALAVLASVEVKIALPSQHIEVYTFGAPRVGNVAFGTYCNALIPDNWHIVGTNDPVARIPKGSYKRSGQRVTLGSLGNVDIHPTHFEASLFGSVGGKVSDHMLAVYGRRVGQFLKAQFVPSLSLSGASQGVAKLAKVMNLERTILVQPLDGKSLSDQNLDVEPVDLAEVPRMKKKKPDDGNTSSLGCFPCGKGRSKGVDNELEADKDMTDVDYGENEFEIKETMGDKVGVFMKNVFE